VGDARGHLADPSQLLGPQGVPLGLPQPLQHGQRRDAHALRGVPRIGARHPPGEPRQPAGVRRLVELLGRRPQPLLGAEQGAANGDGDDGPREQPAQGAAEAQRHQPEGDPVGELAVRRRVLRQHPLVEPGVLVRRLEDFLREDGVDQVNDLRVLGLVRVRQNTVVLGEEVVEAGADAAHQHLLLLGRRGALGVDERLAGPLAHARHGVERLLVEGDEVAVELAAGLADADLQLLGRADAIDVVRHHVRYGALNATDVPRRAEGDDEQQRAQDRDRNKQPADKLWTHWTSPVIPGAVQELASAVHVLNSRGQSRAEIWSWSDLNIPLRNRIINLSGRTAGVLP
jgi:hypothetical protein